MQRSQVLVGAPVELAQGHGLSARELHLIKRLIEGAPMKIDDCVLALLQLTLYQETRAWKTFDFDAMDRLFHKGYIFDPLGKARSVL